MKRELFVFLCMALLLGSCADLSVDKEESLEADLPEGFNWQVYAKINKDVAGSQIIMDVRGEYIKYAGPDSLTKLAENCVKLLSDGDFARKVYVEYVGCPKDGWDISGRCPGIYAGNTNNKGECPRNSIGRCWEDGWDETRFLQDLNGFKTFSTAGTIKMMCYFMPKRDELQEAKDYLENFELNQTLVEQHYISLGRHDGRPYKYCDEEGYSCEEKTPEIADKRGSYYDYGRYTFCLNSEQKICVN